MGTMFMEAMKPMDWVMFFAWWVIPIVFVISYGAFERKVGLR